MADETAISIENVSKTFTTRSDAGKEGRFFKKNTKKTRNVINEICLDIKKGEVFGIIGRNGSGKSTLLKMISKIMNPDAGTIKTYGRVASILELGMGFHQDLSGKENVYIKGSMYGFTKEQIDERLNDIVRYAELEDYIDLPVRIYSSGMASRLAFSIMINVDADILILDEILSTGDLAFSKKSKAHFFNMKNKGKTIVIVSHSMSMMREMCDRVAWIDEGKIREVGLPNVVCGHYETELAESLDVIRELAESGVSDSQNTLGCMYRDGYKVQKNIELAIYWFEEAIRNDNDDAKINLADMIISKSIPGERSRAIDLYMSAAEKGNLEARNKLSRSLIMEKTDVGKDVANDFKKLLPSNNPQIFYEYADLLMKIAWNNEDRMKAMEWFLKSAEFGNPNAMYQIALMYRDGNGPKRNDSDYLKWLKKAANCNHIPSQLMLGNMYRDGIKVESDESEAFSWYEMAANNNNLDAIYQTAMMCREGKGTEKNIEESDKWLKLYSEHGFYRQINTLADSFSHSKNGVYNPKLGLKWYSLNAVHSNESKYQLSKLLIDEGDQGVSEALSLLVSAAERGHRDSAALLLNMYGMGMADEPILDTAIKSLKDIAERGDSSAAYILGSAYLERKLSIANVDAAIKYLKLGAIVGNQFSLQKLGEIYCNGTLVEQNIEEGIKWFKKGAISGNFLSAVKLIDLYGAGAADTDILDFAVMNLKKMCLMGSMTSMRTLGIFYRDGRGVEKDIQKSIHWLITASNFGDPTSKYILGEIYRDGKGVDKDLFEAYRWYYSASEQGDLNSILAIISMRSTPAVDEVSFDNALKKLNQLAVSGNILAMRSLGMIYMDGKRVSRDIDISKKWFTKASELGDSFSRNKLDKI